MVGLDGVRDKKLIFLFTNIGFVVRYKLVFGLGLEGVVVETKGVIYRFLERKLLQVVQITDIPIRRNFFS